jgi:hypothetical protein
MISQEKKITLDYKVEYKKKEKRKYFRGYAQYQIKKLILK